MLDGLAAIFSGIDDDAIPLREAFLAGDFCGDPEQMSEERGMVRTGISKRGEMLARNDEDMHGSFGSDVSEGVALLVLIDRRGGDASFNDFAEQTAHGGFSVQEGGLRPRHKRRDNIGLETYTMIAVLHILCCTSLNFRRQQSDDGTGTYHEEMTWTAAIF